MHRKVRTGFWGSKQLLIDLLFRRLDFLNVLSRPGLPLQEYIQKTQGIFNPLRDLATANNDVVSQLSDCRSISDKKIYVGPVHLSSLSTKRLTP